MHRRAFTLIELLVAIAIIGILLAIVLPAMEHVRHKGYIAACASNLHQLGVGLAMYANSNRGDCPRTTYDPASPLTLGTGTNSADPFSAGGPKPNDVTAPIWLLLRVQKMPTSLVICPYDDVNEFEADRALPASQSNFSNFAKNLGYSYANPYARRATDVYRLTNRMTASFAVMADLNPGVNVARHADVFAAVARAPASQMKLGNSGNHEREGQNVLYADGHVDYTSTPLCGPKNDNIYTSQDASTPDVMSSPSAADDCVLLPPD